MSRPDEAVRTDGESGNVEFPVGFYTDVKVIPINGSGSLRGGTGTFSETSTFSAGMFDQGDLPEVGTFYNIWGSNSGNLYHFPGWRCVASGTTGDFQR
jgi:hypothetical protein